MKIFVCEYITGGGLYREPLPYSLAQEGAIMRDALLCDLGQIHGLELRLSLDARLHKPQGNAEVTLVYEQDDVWSVWEDLMTWSDAVWLIAPESGGILARLVDLVETHHKCQLGCSSEAVRLASSKLATAEHLRAAGIKVVPTCRALELLPANNQLWDSKAWVAKPDDGIGCEDTLIFDNWQRMRQWLLAGQRSEHVVQPLLPGVPGSLSMLCRAGEAWLLSCNRQAIQQRDDRFVYQGGVLNALASHWDACEALAQAVAAAIPGLNGYVGVDILLHEQQVTVLEINPRLTTSYAGLHAAIGCNPAKLVLDLLYNSGFSQQPFRMPAPLACQIVHVQLKP